MAKQLTKGLHYFPKYVNYYDDFKIIDLMSKYGPIGQTIYDYILTQVFKEGYYIEIPVDKLALLAVRAVGAKWVTKEFVINVITYCGDIGLFRVDLLSMGVITSADIQRHYVFVKDQLRHKFQKEKYWVLDENDEEMEHPVLSAPLNKHNCTFTGNNCANIADKCAVIATKEKESKVKKRKGKESCANTTADAATASVFRTFEDCGFRISAHASERLLRMCDDYSSEWVEEAIKRATDRGKKSLSYIEGILRSWDSAGAMDDGRKENHAEHSSNYGETEDAFDPFAGEEIL